MAIISDATAQKTKAIHTFIHWLAFWLPRLICMAGKNANRKLRAAMWAGKSDNMLKYTTYKTVFNIFLSSVMHWNQMDKVKISCHKQSISITSFFTAWIHLNLQNGLGCGDVLGSKHHSCFIERHDCHCEKRLKSNTDAGFDWARNVNFENFARNRSM